MQQMGVGMTAMQTLCGFLDLPTSASCHHHIKQAEAVGGPVQIALQKKSEEEAILKEIEVTKTCDDFKTHVSTVTDHEYGPLPMVTGCFGKNTYV